MPAISRREFSKKAATDTAPARGRGRGVQTSVGKGSIDWVKSFSVAALKAMKV
jgi:hypothetical protein